MIRVIPFPTIRPLAVIPNDVGTRIEDVDPLYPTMQFEQVPGLRERVADMISARIRHEPMPYESLAILAGALAWVTLLARSSHDTVYQTADGPKFLGVPMYLDDQLRSEEVRIVHRGDGAMKALAKFAEEACRYPVR